MNGQELLEDIKSPKIEPLFESLYGAEEIGNARQRYEGLIAGLLNFPATPARAADGGAPGVEVKDFPEVHGDIHLFSAPGRTELGGNHTDHNHGKVLAASIQLDAVVAVAPRRDSLAIFRSAGYPDAVVDLADTKPRAAEHGKAEGLIRGIGAEFARLGASIGGFTAIADSAVKAGSGLSSSAVMEALLGRIFDSLSGAGIPPLELAKIGQRAENLYFGKPSGLMDQIACVHGGTVAIDFENPEDPKIEAIDFDLESIGYILCVVDTQGSHAGLAEDYASIPREMQAVAAFFGKAFLRELSQGMVMEKAREIRMLLGDRALLRALHFFSENARVDQMLWILKRANSMLDVQERQSALGKYLELVNESGFSSWDLLQNIYSPTNAKEQGIALALALTKNFFPKNSASRVHGGGFAGTIQAYIPRISLGFYRDAMEAVFGPGAVTSISIRKTGAVELAL